MPDPNSTPSNIVIILNDPQPNHTEPVSTLDVTATTFDAAGLPVPPWTHTAVFWSDGSSKLTTPAAAPNRPSSTDGSCASGVPNNAGRHKFPRGIKAFRNTYPNAQIGVVFYGGRIPFRLTEDAIAIPWVAV